VLAEAFDVREPLNLVVVRPVAVFDVARKRQVGFKGVRHLRAAFDQ
jgi:hypothetical protein